jgi:hypothetical protein
MCREALRASRSFRVLADGGTLGHDGVGHQGVRSAHGALATSVPGQRLSPFGPADGVQLRVTDMVDLHMTEIDELLQSPSSRLIVARSGTGKSAFMNRVHGCLREAGEIATAEEIQRGHPGLEELTRIGERWQPPACTDLWGDIWRAAILRSYTSQVLCGVTLRGIDDIDGFAFRHTWRDVLRDCADCTTPVNVFSQVREIVGNLDSESAFRGYLESEKWASFAAELAVLIGQQARSACLLIDIEDDMTAEVPGPWAYCQRGLLKAITWLRHSPLAGHLSVLATSREQHYATLMSVESDIKIRDSVLLLDFDERDTVHYLYEMIKEIDSREAVAPQAGGLSRLVDTGPLENIVRGCEEDPTAYLTRHTRSQPRDIVVLGNELAQRQRRAGKGKPLQHDEVRRSVRGCARLFGNEQLKTCALLLSAGMSREDVAAEYLLSTSGTPGGYENPTVRARLDRTIEGIGRDRFGPRTLQSIRIKATGEFASDVIEALWRSGLLGYTSPEFPPGHAAFFSLRVSRPEIPASGEYAFHPCLIDALMLTPGGQTDLPTTPIADPA